MGHSIAPRIPVIVTLLRKGVRSGTLGPESHKCAQGMITYQGTEVPHIYGGVLRTHFLISCGSSARHQRRLKHGIRQHVFYGSKFGSKRRQRKQGRPGDTCTIVIGAYRYDIQSGTGVPSAHATKRTQCPSPATVFTGKPCLLILSGSCIESKVAGSSAYLQSSPMDKRVFKIVRQWLTDTPASFRQLDSM